MLTRALPNLKLFMTWHSGRKSNFLEMSDVMIYSPFDTHVAQAHCSAGLPLNYYYPELVRKINIAWQDTNSNSIQTKCLENLLEKYIPWRKLPNVPVIWPEHRFPGLFG